MNIVLFRPNEDKGSLPLSDTRAQHIINVLGLKEGDYFDAGIINKGSGKAVIHKIESNYLYYCFISFSETVDKHPAVLLTSATRPLEAKKIIKNAATVGVSAIMIAVTDKSEKSYIDSSLWKNNNYSSYLIDGASQAFASDIPKLILFRSIDECLEKHAFTFDIKAVLDNYEASSPLSELSSGDSSSNAILAVGGERGWSSRERDLFRKYGFTIFSMGKRVLKTETACTAGLILLYSRIRYL